MVVLYKNIKAKRCINTVSLRGKSVAYRILVCRNPRCLHSSVTAARPVYLQYRARQDSGYRPVSCAIGAIFLQARKIRGRFPSVMRILGLNFNLTICPKERKSGIPESG